VAEQFNSRKPHARLLPRIPRRGLELEILEDRRVLSGGLLLSTLSVPEPPVSEVPDAVSVRSGPVIEATVVLNEEPPQRAEDRDDVHPIAPPANTAHEIISPVDVGDADVVLTRESHASVVHGNDGPAAKERGGLHLGWAQRGRGHAQAEIEVPADPSGTTGGSLLGNGLHGKPTAAKGSERSSSPAAVPLPELAGTEALDLAFAGLGPAADHAGFTQSAAEVLAAKDTAAETPSANGHAGGWLPEGARGNGGSQNQFDELLAAVRRVSVSAPGAIADAALVLPAGADGAAPDLLPAGAEEITSDLLTEFSFAGEAGVEGLLQQLLTRLNRLGEDVSGSLMSREMALWVLAGALAGGVYAYSRRWRRTWREKDQTSAGSSSWNWLPGSAGFTPRVDF
jgi:hypothetical protein